nr:DUF882 domain-containing protein [Ancylobacter crimeensis]
MGLVCGTDMLQDAVANGDTRSLTMHHVHSGEDINITFKRDGRYDPAALQKLNVFLQDWRRKEPTKMDPALYDIIWEVYRESGATQPVQVIGGYRSPATNAMLRARSRGVAQMSQHTLGKAMDFFIPGVPLYKLREAGLRLQRGGVGFYPTSGSPFVHMDTGGVRHWPRMTRPELARVFPNGKTVHIPVDGKPMPGYALALAEIEARGSRPGGAGAAFAGAFESGGKTGGKSKNLFAALFGKDDDEEEGAAPAPAPARAAAPTRVAAANGAGASSDDEDDSPAPTAAAPASVAVPPPSRVAAAASVVANADVPLPIRKPEMPSAPVTLAMASADVPLPMARPGLAAPGDEQVGTAAPATDVPVPMARPQFAAASVPAQPSTIAPDVTTSDTGAQLASATPLPLLITNGFTRGDAGTVNIGADQLSYASAGSFVPPRQQPGRAASAPMLPTQVASAAPSHVPSSVPGPARIAATRPASAEAQAEIRKLFASPTVARDTALRTPELRRFAAFVAAPRQVVDGGFGRDASSGLETKRFSGAAVVAVRVVTLASAAPLPPRRTWTAAN